MSSCGYSLRENSNDLSKQDLIIIADNSDLNLELIAQLKDKDNTIFRAKNITNGNNLVLKIKKHEIRKFIGAIGVGARTTQVRLDYSISYELTNKKKIKIKNTFKSTNYLSFNQSDLLAIEREEKILIKKFINDGIKNIEFLLALNNNEDSLQRP